MKNGSNKFNCLFHKFSLFASKNVSKFRISKYAIVDKEREENREIKIQLANLEKQK